MNSSLSLTRCFLLLIFIFSSTLYLCAGWDRSLIIHPSGFDLARAQESDDGEEEGGEEADNEEEDAGETATVIPRLERTEKGTAQRISRAGDQLRAHYSFVNFNKDQLSASFAMSAKDYARYLGGYGYTDAELNNLKNWQNSTRRKEWERALKKSGRAAAGEAVAAVDWEYNVRLKELFRSRGFALQEGDVIACDIPAIARRNAPLIKPLSLAIQKISEARRYSSEETVGAVVSMVQTALRYKLPPMLDGKLHTGGLLPPARALLSGWGDCDTKTALLGSILGNWSGIRLVGIALPGHYLSAIRRIPAKGDMFVRYNGAEYVLIEPAGPAWLEPGTVGSATAELLQGAEGYKIEPFF